MGRFDQLLVRKTPYLIMGILNVTPDSFSDGGQYVTVDAAYRRIEKMIAEGADCIDIGAESSRPGSDAVSADEEMQRLVPILSGLQSRFECVFTIDTYKAKVADMALEFGVSAVNDITACSDPDMVKTIVSHDAGVILMHMRGCPKTMQMDVYYDDVCHDVHRFLLDRATAIRSAGVSSVLIDPGIGFGKLVAHNVELLRGLSALCDTGFPVCLGVSRKSFIGQLNGGDKDENRLPGSLAAAVLGAIAGCRLFRVHDVAATRQALRIVNAVTVGG